MLYAILTILKKKRRLCSKQLVLIGVTAIVTLTPVIAYYLWAIHISHTYPPYYIAAGEYWVWKFGLRYFLEQNYFLPKLLSQLSWFWTKPLIVLFIVGLFLRPPQSEPFQELTDSSGKAPWLFHWWVLAFVFYYLIAAQGLVNNPTNINIINPAVAVLTANVLIAIASFGQRIAGLPASIALIAAILLIVAGVGHRALEGFALRPWAENDYKLGLALHKASPPNDLVVTATSTTGSTVAIYYSQRRGWTFPPAYSWSSLKSMSLLDDSEAIRLLKELSIKGANWFGIVNEQNNRLRKDNPKLVEYIERVFERYQESPEFVIYRISSQK